MGEFKINDKSVFTQTGSDEPVVSSNVDFPVGHVINFHRETNSTRTAWSDSADNTFWSFTYNKKIASSDLFCLVNLSMRNNYSDVQTWVMKYGSGSWILLPMGYNAGFTANSRPMTSTCFITDATQTGDNTIYLRYYTQNSGTGNKPAAIWNPSSSDDARHTQEISTITISEIKK